MTKIFNFILLVILISFQLTGCKKHSVVKIEANGDEKDSSPTVIFKEKTNDGAFSGNLDECIKKSAFNLPYDREINFNTVKYTRLKCENISGIQKFLCNEDLLRYISLPKYREVNLILVPMDCGDFNYRYFLLTIHNNKVTDSIYVEGEWYEPEDESYREITNFTISKQYIITVKTKSLENEKFQLKEENKFKISEVGVLSKIK